MPLETPYLVVRVAGHLCALPVAAGMEVLRLPELQPEGSGAAASGLLGLATIRGALMPVLDLAVLLGFASGAELVRMISVRIGERSAGLAVEEVIGVHALAFENLETLELPGSGERVMGRFELGFARLMEAGGLVPESVWAELETELRMEHAQGAA